MKFRRNTAAGAAANNRVLAAGEPGFTTDTGMLKIGDGATAWNSLPPALSGTYAPVGMYGNSVAFWGDSITGFGTVYGAWAEYLSLSSIKRGATVSHSGYTSTQLAPLITEITGLTPKPSACVVLMGTNDAIAAVSVATFYANLRTVVGALRAAGILPVLSTIPPINLGNSTENSRARGINMQIRRYALTEGLPVVDQFAVLTDATTGTWKSGYDSGDGTHPAQAAQAAMGQAVADALDPMMHTYRSTLAWDGADPSNLALNAAFIAATAGVPTGWWTQGGSNATHTTSDGDAAMNGAKWADFALASSSGQHLLWTNTITPTVGRTYHVGCLFRASSLAGSTSQLWVQAVFYDAGNALVAVTNLVGGIAVNIAKGQVSADVVCPAGATQFRLGLAGGPGNGSYGIAQPFIYDLTALAVA